MSSKSFVEDCVSAMNVYRGRHQASPLKHNSQITSVAQSWADRLAASGSLSHNPNATYRGERLGENCAMRWTSDQQGCKGQEIADQWYSEVERYNFNKHAGPNTGHFTQVVWKGSREVGIGRARSRDGKWFVVANFFPAGNFIGRNAENVFPTRDGNVALPSKKEDTTAKPVAQLDGRDTKQSSGLRSWFTGGSSGTGSGTGSGETVSRIGVGESASVKREVQTETVRRGADTVTRTTIIETRTTADGRTETTRTVNEETKGRGTSAHDTALMPMISSMCLKDEDRSGERTGPNASQKEFANDVLRCHNVYRRKHGSVGGLTLNDELTRMAQEWAEHLASIKLLKHSNQKYGGQPVGENVAAKSGTGQTDYTGQQLVDQWYSEEAKYNYSKPADRSSDAGHFTQLVWKSSQELGVGKARSVDGRQVYVVCIYFPAGNFVGRYQDNVLSPRQ